MWANSLGASKFALVFILSLSVASCGRSNAIESFANTKDGPSLLQKATTMVNRGSYGEAIAACEEMTGAYRAGAARMICASAYAGGCGYNMMGVVNMLSGYDPDPDTASPKIFEFLMEQYHGSTLARMANCEAAAELMKAAGAAPARTDDENFFMILMGLTHMGVILNTLADTNDDDVPDPTFNHCDNTDFSVAQVDQLGRAFWDLYRSAENVSSPITAPLVAALDELSQELNDAAPAYNFLSETADPYAFSADQRKAIRAFVAEGDYAGLNLACGNFVACFLACP